MSRRKSVLLLASWLAVPGLAWAEDLPPEKIAAIRRDEQAAKAKVGAAYGNRKPSEMSNEERQKAIQDEQAAGLGVMEKHGVSDKDYARQVARMKPEELEAVEQAEKKLEAREKEAQAAREAAEKKKGEEAPAPEDIPIQQGISEDNPVELEAAEGAGSVVEQGLPPGEQDSDAPVEEAFDAASEAPADPAPKGRRRK